jgi:hypothetical protein
LRYAKLNVDDAFEQIKKYYKYKLKYKKVLKKLTPSSVKEIHEGEIVQVLPDRDSNGCRLIVINVKSRKFFYFISK